VKEDPTKFAPLWTNVNPAKPKAQFLATSMGSGAWAEVTGFHHDPLADVPLLFTLTPVADILAFQWTPEQLEDGFRGAQVSSSGLATGGQKDGDAVNTLIDLIKGGRQGSGDDPDTAWTSDMAAALKGAEDRASSAGASLISALHFKLGMELIQFVEWVSSRVKSWSGVRKQMPAVAD
jgi:hypothetical protein